LKDLYDGEIRFQDDQLASLWKKLEELELLSNTLVIITSDHGETIGEHGFLDHGHNLYQEQVRIPLIIVDPKQWIGGKKISTHVQLIDIAPTILEYLNMDPDKTMQGKSLISLLNSVEDRVILAEIDIDSHPRFAAFRRNQKMLLRNADKYVESSDSKHLLFDLSSSEGEKRNLISERPELRQSMSMELRTIFGALEKLQHQGTGEIDEETREKLKALGYIE
jgi:arylsulfatase A-like enzyme